MVCEHLMLFYPWRNEEGELLKNQVQSCLQKEYSKIIQENKAKYVYNCNTDISEQLAEAEANTIRENNELNERVINDAPIVEEFDRAVPEYENTLYIQ